MNTLTATGTFHTAPLTTAVATPDREPAADRGKVAPGRGKDLPADDGRDLERVAHELEKRSRMIGRALHFEVDLDGGQAAIQVLDRETGEMIRRIPREKLSPFLAANRNFDLRLFDDRV